MEPLLAPLRLVIKALVLCHWLLVWAIAAKSAFSANAYKRHDDLDDAELGRATRLHKVRIA